LEKASGDHKDPNDTLTDNNNTITEDNYESRDQVRSDTHQRQSKEVKVSKSRNTKSAQKPEPAKYSDNHLRNKSAPAHRVQSSNNIIHGTNATYQPRQYSSSGNIAREITRTNYEHSRSSNAMRKTEHKMSDLSVTGNNVQSNYKTRTQMARSAAQQPQRLQRRYTSGLHKNNASTGVAKQTIGGGHSQQYGTVSAQWLREHC